VSTHISPEDAAALLSEIDAARSAMRRVVREHRGHYHLWIWGLAWVAMPLTAHLGGDPAARFFPWICLGGVALSILVGFTQGRQIRRRVDSRLIAMLVTVWAFAALFPWVLHAPGNVRVLYTFVCLVAMQSYVIAGLWTDTYLLWVGIVVAALVLIGYFLFPAFFWLWMAAFGGGTLILTGFYVRHFWR
jgi:hypothetical protein